MKDVNIRSLADFKRFLGRPGATIETLRNDVMTRNGQTPKPGLRPMAPARSRGSRQTPSSSRATTGSGVAKPLSIASPAMW